MRSMWPISKSTTAPKGRVFVGLSGGVDSAVSAALLKSQGYEVVAAFIWIALPDYPCAAGEDKISAMRAAAHLRIPFVEVDLSKEYKKRVFDLSMREFTRGATPNPDALCNREIKFGLFYDWCMGQGADFVATGHYTQIAPQNPLLRRDAHDPNSSADGFVSLLAGADQSKDQSYFLWAVPQDKLAKTLFPIGKLKKTKVRALAKKFRLPNAKRPDSQGLCFLGDIGIEDMLAQELTLVPGDVLNEQGEVVGRHTAVPAYTLGQRHGFELNQHTPNTHPHYVIAKDAEFNTIVVSPHKFPQQAKATRIELADTNWIGPVPDGHYHARYRYHGQLIAAHKVGNTVTLAQPHWVPQGQSLVLYEGTRCMGGGVVDTSEVV